MNYYDFINYYEVEDENTIVLDFGENDDLSDIKDFLKVNTGKTFIVYQTGDLPPFFEDYNYINLAQDVADNFSLELYDKCKEFDNLITAMESLFCERVEYIQAKYDLGYPKLTNAQAVAKYLDLKKSNRQVDLPLDVDEQDEVVKYFLSGSFLKKNYPIKLCNLEVCFSGGGIHGSINHYFKTYSYLESPIFYTNNHTSTKDTTSTKAYYFDIKSFYPSILYHYNLLDNEKFKKLYKEHFVKPTHATKLVLNTISGLLELYEPQVAVTMRATGQLLIYEMLKKLDGTINLLNANTDGIIFETDDIEKVREIIKDCEISKVSTIKEQEIERIAIKDINNLFIRFTDDTYKIVGYLNFGVNNKGKFSINDNEIWVKWTVLKTLYPNSVADLEEDDERAFRYYVPLGSYENFKHRGKIYNDKVLVCYATSEQGSALYKKSAGKYIKVPNIPDNVTLDENEIDYTYYENKVKEVLKDYGYNQNEDISNNLRKEANMPEKENLNVYQRLLRARSDFLKSGAKKTGHNKFSGFYYFTLDDLVPVITSIFTKYELIALTDFTSDIATMTIYSADDPMDCVVFHSPMPTDESLGNAITNGMQRIGAVQTYQRRYLYLMALDIIEPELIDEQDNTVREPKQVVEQVNTTTPQKVVSKTDGHIVTEQDRTNAKEQVLKQDVADATTIENLQKAIDVAIEKKPDVADVINKLYAQTNHLKTITTQRARSVIEWLDKELAK